MNDRDGVAGDWVGWAARWTVASLLVMVLTGIGYLVPAVDGVVQLLFPLVLVPSVAVHIVLPMLLVAAAVRWSWLRLGGGRHRRATSAMAVAAGVASAPVALSVRFGLELVWSEGLGSLHSAVISSLLPVYGDLIGLFFIPVAGGAAGYLAQARVPVRSWCWWSVVVAAVAVNAVGAGALQAGGVVRFVPWRSPETTGGAPL